MDIALRAVMLLGIVFSLIAFGITVKWGVRPEEISIERFRISPGRRLSHLDLIIRAYLGAGLVPWTFFLIPWLFIPWLIFGSYNVALWFALVSIGTLVGGTIAYCGFRLSKFRRLTSHELQSDNDKNTKVFVLSEI